MKEAQQRNSRREDDRSKGQDSEIKERLARKNRK
jgi:hypothetical protein